MKKIPSLDGLRAVSIIFVIVSHISNTDGLPPHLYKHLSLRLLGLLGVNIFFVISGFLITSLLLNEKTSHNNKIDLKKFYQRRFLRILPVCYLYILIIFILNKPLDFNIRNSVFWHALTYTMNFCMIQNWFLAHLWTLGYEEQFYLFWPWATKLTFKKMSAFALIIIAYESIDRVLRSHAMSHFFPKWALMPSGSFLPPVFLMVGSLLAISHYTHPNAWKSSILKNRFIFLLAIAILGCASFLNSHPEHALAIIVVPFGQPIASLCIAYIIAYTITIKDTMAFKFLNHPLMVYIGVLSYSIYIWQQLFLVMTNFTTSPIWWFQRFPINIILLFCVSIASYHLWEKNFLRIKERFKVG